MRGARFRRRVDARGLEVAKEWLPDGYDKIAGSHRNSQQHGEAPWRSACRTG
jgi:hypothetical protein